MENPFTALGEVIHEGLEKLHKRADAVEKDLCGFKDEVQTEIESIGDLKDRIAKLEAMFSPETLAAVTDKVSSAGSDASAGQSETKTDAIVTTPTATTTIAVVPGTADATPVLTGAGSITVQPGTTVHTDTDTGVTTTVPHDGSEPTATDASGVAVSVPAAAVAEAVQATVDAGVTAPAIATGVDVPAVQPVV